MPPFPNHQHKRLQTILVFTSGPTRKTMVVKGIRGVVPVRYCPFEIPMCDKNYTRLPFLEDSTSGNGGELQTSPQILVRVVLLATSRYVAAACEDLPRDIDTRRWQRGGCRWSE